MVRLPCGSRSTRSPFIPCSEKATPRFSAVVVLATPPFWLAKAITLPTAAPFEMSSRVPGRGSRRASPIRPFLSSDSSRTLYLTKCRFFLLRDRGEPPPQERPALPASFLLCIPARGLTGETGFPPCLHRPSSRASQGA